MPLSLRTAGVISGFFLLPLGLMAYRMAAQDFHLEDIIPRRAYEVDTLLSLHGHGSPVRVSTFLPVSDERQRVDDESNSSAGLGFEVRRVDGNREATWESRDPIGEAVIQYHYEVLGRRVRYELPERAPIPAELPERLHPYLRPTPAIQVDDPEIGGLLDRIAPAPRYLRETLFRIQEFTDRELETVPFKGTTDALTAYRLGRASCNGKSRLFVALARRAGIPARLVGGLILREGSRRTSHQWVEAWVNGHWVPFCPTNRHAAEIPETYLTLYRGDEILLTHTPNIQFDYAFKVRRAFRTEAGAEGTDLSRGPDLWRMFQRLGIPLELLKIILMLPVGTIVLVLFRNVLGVETYGTFLPVLVAAAARNTGIYWGLLGFLLVVAWVYLLRWPLDRFRLLHTPKLAILLTLVILSTLALSAGAVQLGFTEIAHVSLFPIAILTLTTERFALRVEEAGFRPAVGVLAWTLLAVFSCYGVMENAALQALVLGFPELLLLVIGIHLGLGRWMGIRVMEYLRFRRLIFGPSRA